MSFFSRLRQATTNAVVNVGQGTTPHQTLDSSKAFIVVAAVALVTIIGSGWFINYSIRNATRIPSIKNVNASAVAKLNALKGKDTDGDGLSDYDELFSFKTSPYLKDSDGDGVSDSDEVKKNSDPNCPSGKVCSSFSLLTSPVDANGNLSPAFLRQALKAAGVPQAQLDKTDDATLQKIYQNVVGSTTTSNTNQATNSTVTNVGTQNTNTSGADQLNNLSSAEIRQLLIQNGVDQTTLSSVDDATLKQIFLQASNTNQ